MKIRNIFVLVFRQTIRQFFMFCLSCLLCTAAFGLVGYILFFEGSSTYGERQVKKILNSKLENVGVIFLEGDDWPEEGNQLIQSLQKLKEIESVGYSDIVGYNVEGLEEIYEIQQKNPTRYKYDDSICVEGIEVSRTLLNFCNIDCSLTEPEDGVNFLLYLGSNFKEIPVGKVYTAEGSDWKYQVAGILKKDTSWVANELYSVSDAIHLSFTTSLNNLVLVVPMDETECPVGAFYYATDKTADAESIQQTVLEIARQKNITINISTLKSILQEKASVNNQMTEYMRKFLWMVCITTVIIMACIQVSRLVSESRQYGIFYAAGLTNKDVVAMFLIENVVKLGIGFLFAIGVLQLYLDSTFRDSWYWMKLSHTIFQSVTLPGMFLFSVILFSVISIVPLIVVRRAKPVTLLGGNIS